MSEHHFAPPLRPYKGLPITEVPNPTWVCIFCGAPITPYWTMCPGKPIQIDPAFKTQGKS